MMETAETIQRKETIQREETEPARNQDTEETAAETPVFSVLTEQIPVQQYEGGQYQVDVYGSFTQLKNPDGTTTFLEDSRLLMKRGNMILVSAEMNYLNGRIDQVVVDAITSGNDTARYLSVLEEDHRIEDYYDQIQWPDELSNAGIQEISSTLDTSDTVLMVRYTDNTVAAFNYVTGKLLFKDESEKTSLSFGEYVGNWVTEKWNSLWGPDTIEYNKIKVLEEELKGRPIDAQLKGTLAGNGQNLTSGSQIVYNVNAANSSKAEQSGLSQMISDTSALENYRRAGDTKGSLAASHGTVAEDRVSEEMIAGVETGLAGTGNLSGTVYGENTKAQASSGYETVKNGQSGHGSWESSAVGDHSENGLDSGSSVAGERTVGGTKEELAGNAVEGSDTGLLGDTMGEPDGTSVGSIVERADAGLIGSATEGVKAEAAGNTAEYVNAESAGSTAEGTDTESADGSAEGADMETADSAVEGADGKTADNAIAGADAELMGETSNGVMEEADAESAGHTVNGESGNGSASGADSISQESSGLQTGQEKTAETAEGTTGNGTVSGDGLEQEKKENTETEIADANLSEARLGQFITVYDPETGTYELYDTQEYLNQGRTSEELLGMSQKLANIGGGLPGSSGFYGSQPGIMGYVVTVMGAVFAALLFLRHAINKRFS